MSPAPQSARILIGVGAGIAAYKVAFVVSRLVQRGHPVRVALSTWAHEFVGARTFEGLCGATAIRTPTQIDPDGSAPHIVATRSAALFVVAPATADLIARLAAGAADDAVCLAALACTAPRLLCPAMNDAMWQSAAVQDNVARLIARGWRVLGPVVGHLAEGYDAIGRMVEPEAILAEIDRLLAAGRP